MRVLIGYVIIGFIVGALGRLVAPGRRPMGCLLTIGVGIAGAVIGGYVSRQILGTHRELLTFIVSVIVAAVIVALIRPRRF
jgi:uncharacterized membrane protein YeaQ/YmgE (transglycosylase-associated protein family)